MKRIYKIGSVLLQTVKQRSLEFVVFVCGAAVMVFELVGSRILAPYIGTSLYVWTSLIGVVLGALSIGYFLGGRIADKHPYPKPLSFAILCAAVSIGLVGFFKDAVLAALASLIVEHIEVRAFFSSLALFGPASIFLGMVSPFAARLKINAVSGSGATVGGLYALSTLGSIAGTFLAGFFLIPFFGSTKILFFLAAILLLTSMTLLPMKTARRGLPFQHMLSISLLVSFLIPLTHNHIRSNLIDVDTAYNRIWIFNGAHPATGKQTLNLMTDPFGIQSAMFLESDEPVFEYLKFYRLAEFFNPNIKKVLLIGGGAYSYPKIFLKQFPNGAIDVVEIDPKLTELARAYFRLRDDGRLRIFHEDGRVFINRVEERYDAIFSDAFTSASSIPFHLTTIQAVRREFEMLREGGLTIVNTISAIDGERGKFLRAEYATYRAIFPQVFLFPVASNDPHAVQNILLVALKSPRLTHSSENTEIAALLARQWKKEIPLDMPVLTDDFAPVDYYRRNTFF